MQPNFLLIFIFLKQIILFYLFIYLPYNIVLVLPYIFKCASFNEFLLKIYLNFLH